MFLSPFNIVIYGIILTVMASRKIILWGIIFFAIGLFACQKPEPEVKQHEEPAKHIEKELQAAPQELKILTTIAPLYSFTKNITGDIAIVENLLPSGVGPHEYSLSPEDVKRIAEADVLIKNGVNLEKWLDKAITAVGELDRPSSKKLVVVDTSKGLEIINNDPHIWLSPRNAVMQVKNIRDALMEADPDNAETYRENAADYIKRLEGLDKEISDRVKTWKRKEFVSFHSAFFYFSRDYGLKQAAASLSFFQSPRLLIK
jgi:ABC-type Zn uptake system ZnuABC Zn-binding protein ZnuA